MLLRSGSLSQYISVNREAEFLSWSDLRLSDLGREGLKVWVLFFDKCSCYIPLRSIYILLVIITPILSVLICVPVRKVVNYSLKVSLSQQNCDRGFVCPVSNQ